MPGRMAGSAPLSAGPFGHGGVLAPELLIKLHGVPVGVGGSQDGFQRHRRDAGLAEPLKERMKGGLRKAAENQHFLIRREIRRRRAGSGKKPCQSADGFAVFGGRHRTQAKLLNQADGLNAGSPLRGQIVA